MYSIIMYFCFVVSFYNAEAFCSKYNSNSYPEKNNEGDIGCHLNASERIQIAIVADITITNFPNVKKVFSRKSKEIIDAVTAVYKDSEFAITTHANYDNTAWNRGPHIEKELCYERKLNFTKNASAIEEVTKGLQQYAGGPGPGYEENALPAAAFAISDNNLGWIRENVDKEGRNVHRMILLFTDVFSIFDDLKFPRNRTRFKGDGTDTCSGSRPATREQVGQILKKHGCMVIGIYLTGERSQVPCYYEEFFHEFGIPHLYDVFTWDIEENIPKFLADVVKRHLQCVFEDPPAYNTLGL